tara:strand:- start:149 stop:274 length:126 start_codon:yes stop_codon:yes gene_type:complete
MENEKRIRNIITAFIIIIFSLGLESYDEKYIDYKGIVVKRM